MSIAFSYFSLLGWRPFLIFISFFLPPCVVHGVQRAAPDAAPDAAQGAALGAALVAAPRYAVLPRRGRRGRRGRPRPPCGRTPPETKRARK